MASTRGGPIAKHEHVASINISVEPQGYLQATKDWEKRIDRPPILHMTKHGDGPPGRKGGSAIVSILHLPLPMQYVGGFPPPPSGR